MSSSFTTGRADLEKPANGDLVDTWNLPVNANMDAIDACFSGELGVSFTNVNVALTQAQMRNVAIVAIGTLSGNVALLLYPGIRGVFSIFNNTIGAFTLTVGSGSTVPAGSTVLCPQGRAVTVFTDGTGAFFIDDGTAAQIAAQVVPPGAIMDFAMPTAPTGWLYCDGAAVSRTTYAALFANISTTWGAGDGSTTFNLPPLRGQFRRGWDNGSGVDPGRAFASAQTDLFAQHNHGVSDPGHTHTFNENPFASGPQAIVQVPVSNGANPFTTNSATTGISIQNTGGSETRPKNYAVLTCIKT